MSSFQVRGIYELSQCHVTAIVKLQSLGTSTFFNGTSFLSLISPHRCSSGNAQLYNVYLIGSLLAKCTFSHSCVVSAIHFEPSQLAKTSTKPEDLPGLRLEDLPGLRPEDLLSLKILRCYIVKAPYVLEVIKTKLKNNQVKREYYNSSLVIID